MWFYIRLVTTGLSNCYRSWQCLIALVNGDKVTTKEERHSVINLPFLSGKAPVVVTVTETAG